MEFVDQLTMLVFSTTVQVVWHRTRKLFDCSFFFFAVLHQPIGRSNKNAVLSCLFWWDFLWYGSHVGKYTPQWLLDCCRIMPLLWRTISALGTPTPSQRSKLHESTDNANLLVLSLRQIWLQHRLKILRLRHSQTTGLQLTSIMWRAIISVTWPAIAATRADLGSKRRSRCWRQDNQNEGSLIIETSQITNCLN